MCLVTAASESFGHRAALWCNMTVNELAKTTVSRLNRAEFPGGCHRLVLLGMLRAIVKGNVPIVITHGRDTYDGRDGTLLTACDTGAEDTHSVIRGDDAIWF